MQLGIGKLLMIAGTYLVTPPTVIGWRGSITSTLPTVMSGVEFEFVSRNVEVGG